MMILNPKDFDKSGMQGLYWARRIIQGEFFEWELVRVDSSPCRGYEVYTMGWDCSDPIHSYAQYIKADLKDPDGKDYDQKY